MARFYADHNARRPLVADLHNRGHDVTTARSEGLTSAVDGDQLLHAATNGRIFLTNDNDFRHLHLAWLSWGAAWGVSPPPQHAGILRLKQNITAEAIDRRLGRGFSLVNELYLWDDTNGWRRLAPGGREQYQHLD